MILKNFLCWPADILILQLRDTLPKEYKILDQYVDCLPGDSLSPAYPFGGFVLNFNVSTSVHRDWNDLEFCMVLVISSEDCKGGDLCFEELGLAIELKNGDGVLFQSSKLTHFNTAFEGERCSVVFHTDKSGLGWVFGRNNWSDSIFMHSSEDVESEELNYKKI